MLEHQQLMDEFYMQLACVGSKYVECVCVCVRV